MARYIDAEKADVESISCFYGSECRIEDVQEWLDEQPTVDVVEAKRGEWIQLDECANEGVYCSVCHKKVYKIEYANQALKSAYCPNCGAKMDGGKKE